MEKITNSQQETFDFARNLTRKLTGGEVLALSGELGAGKTVFAKGIAKGLGVKGDIDSPTFVIMKIYPVRNNKSGIKNLVHVDAYRLGSAQDLENIGLKDYLGKKDTITVIEWAGKVKEIIPSGSFWVDIKTKQENKRKIIVR
jgi:tRNA threonylcarbamoyladenosine biosynthesis protein TsaE